MTLEEKYSLVRKALVAVVDSDDSEQLNRMKQVIESMEPTTEVEAKERQTALLGIEALLKTQNTTS